MSADLVEQRNAYQGAPPRAWITLRLAARDGVHHQFKLVVDTACPVAFILPPEDLQEFSFGVSSPVSTNLGILQAEWLYLAMPEFALDGLMVGYVSEAINSVRLDHPDFAGLAGLPLLRLFDYAGNGDDFWIRRRS